MLMAWGVMPAGRSRKEDDEQPRPWRVITGFTTPVIKSVVEGLRPWQGRRREEGAASAGHALSHEAQPPLPLPWHVIEALFPCQARPWWSFMPAQQGKTQHYTFKLVLGLILDMFWSFSSCLSSPTSCISSTTQGTHFMHLNSSHIYTYTFLHLQRQHYNTKQLNYHPILSLNMHISSSI